MTFEDAVALDRNSKVVDAAAAYENVISETPRCLSSLINLIVLYWQSTDYGFSAGHHLPADFVAHAGKRLRVLLSNSDSELLSTPEVSFWAKYIAWADFGENLELEECRRFLRLKPSYIEPAMFIFAASHASEAESEAMQLLEDCQNMQTARCRYVASVILGATKRRGLRQLRDTHQTDNP